MQVIFESYDEFRQFTKDNPYPEERNGKRNVFEEPCFGSCTYDTADEAQKALEEIRKHYPASQGWHEVPGWGGFMKNHDGSLTPVIHHAKYV